VIVTLMASTNPFGSVAAVFVTLFACVFLLSLRAWRGLTGLLLNRRVTLLLDGAILVLMFLFILFVIVRFKTLA
jgi:hypothetical protein